MTSIPAITEQAIRSFAGEQNFQNGQQYFHDGAIVGAVRQSMTLKAYCYGSLPEPYRVQVTFGVTGIASGLCSCAVGTSTLYGYRCCKHAAALLLNWHEKPEEFVAVDGLDTILERKDKSEMFALVKELLQKQPEFEWQLTMPPRPGSTRKTLVNPETYRYQVDEAFRHAGREWDAVYGISHELYHITAAAGRFLQEEDYANAAIIYTAAARGTMGHYFSHRDEDGVLASFIQDCVKGLGECLVSEYEDLAARKKIIETIFAIYRSDVDHGGYGFTEDIPPELLQHTSAEEKRTAAEWVHAALSEIQGTDHSADWHRKRYGGLLLALEAEVLDDEVFLRIGRETKRIYEVVDRLLERGRVDAAVEDAKQGEGWQVVKLADLFVQYGQDAAVERLMLELSRQTYHTYIPEWLKNHYLAKNNTASALEVAELIFRKQPGLEGYQEIRELATQLGIWETKRGELLALLDTKEQTYVLAEVALDEGEIEKALELLKVAKSHTHNQSHSYRLTYNNDYGYYSLALKAAGAAEEIQPHASIEIYQQYIDHLIALRGRGNYEAACTYLAKTRALYEKLAENEAWMRYITTLREKNRSLRALKEELASEGL